LPEHQHIDGRRLYATGDMRAHAAAYGQACFEAGTKHDPFESSIAPEQPGKTSLAFEDIFPWMKK